LGGSVERARENFRLSSDHATVFVFGGGTGSENLNRVVGQLVKESADQFQIIHLTGTDRLQPSATNALYHPYPFFMGEMADAYAVADVVISRAGFNAISEIAAWGKPMILVPISGSHQEANARFVAEGGAGVMCDEFSLNSAELYEQIRLLLTDVSVYEQMAQKSATLFSSEGAAAVAKEILSFQQTLAKN
jgi:UDP-N-acetylglucosamine--N-acetylmuramyl-(pentapeptide) pyrophosphoryl-undecaprenol N-acetylglucosamine transferase